MKEKFSALPIIISNTVVGSNNIQMKIRTIYALGTIGLLALGGMQSCQTVQEQVAQLERTEIKGDPHSYSRPENVMVTHLDLDIDVNFKQKEIVGVAHWSIKKNNAASKEIVFDTYELIIDSVKLNNQVAAIYQLSEKDNILGAALTVLIQDSTNTVDIYYRTQEEATALQWLDASQTFGKKHPFLYTQGESIYTRSWIPSQDGPGVRFTYNATVKVPKELRALMSANNDTARSPDGVYTFAMTQPIPSYLMALAVGDVYFKAINDNIGVYAEAPELAKAANEISNLGKMMTAAESLYGPYVWGRYDVLFMPLAFPFGGMENPQLTFATPTILAGDQSLVNLIAHELAHSWSGNLVTNASWNDFWLNEGFTVYFERRIMEQLEGAAYAAMLWDLGIQDLKASTARYQGEMLPYSKLKLELKGQDPDLGLTDFAYEKGAALLLLIEQNIGRPAMDSFVNAYFAHFKFKSITTDQFIDYLNKNLFAQYPKLRQQIQFDQWIFEPGLPNNVPIITNPKFAAVDLQIAAFVADTSVLPNTTEWSTHEWLHFLKALQGKITKEDMTKLDEQYKLTQTGNAEIATVWYTLALQTKYEQAFDAMQNFLKYTGRMKFLEPIYGAMYQQPDYRNMALSTFEKNKQNYHPLSQKSVLNFLK